MSTTLASGSATITDELLISLAEDRVLYYEERRIYQIARQLQAIRSHCCIDKSAEAYRQRCDRRLSDRLDELIDQLIRGQKQI